MNIKIQEVYGYFKKGEYDIASIEHLEQLFKRNYSPEKISSADGDFIFRFQNYSTEDLELIQQEAVYNSLNSGKKVGLILSKENKLIAIVAYTPII